MSKYDKLWANIKDENESNVKLSFGEIEEILGVEIDHSFLSCKKELLGYGYKVEKISMKEKYVIFVKID